MIYKYEFQTEQRLDRFCRKFYKENTEITLGQIFFWIRKWDILVNWKIHKQEYRIKFWDEITLTDITNYNKPKFQNDKFQYFKPWFLEKIKIFENDNYIIFDKPEDYIIHPNSGNNGPNMQYILENIVKKNDLTDTGPSFCFRLDKQTSGILIAGKKYDAIENLNEQIRSRTVEKTYLAICIWKSLWKRTIEYKLEKIVDKKFERWKMIVSQNWLDSKTEVRCLKNINNEILWDITLLEVKLYTGRMHQIRVHLAHIWFPILWDIVYGNSISNRKLFKKIKIKRHFLHCWKYSFFDLNWKKIEIETKVPSSFEKFE